VVIVVAVFAPAPVFGTFGFEVPLPVVPVPLVLLPPVLVPLVVFEVELEPEVPLADPLAEPVDPLYVGVSVPEVEPLFVPVVPLVLVGVWACTRPAPLMASAKMVAAAPVVTLTSFSLIIIV
jgi:hypothetical protein